MFVPQTCVTREDSRKTEQRERERFSAKEKKSTVKNQTHEHTIPVISSRCVLWGPPFAVDCANRKNH